MHLFAGEAPDSQFSQNRRELRHPAGEDAQGSYDRRIASLEAEVSSLKQDLVELKRQLSEFTEQFK